MSGLFAIGVIALAIGGVGAGVAIVIAIIQSMRQKPEEQEA